MSHLDDRGTSNPLVATMNRPLIIAHRGASHDAPENTSAAFRLAWEQGADAIETDLRLTADGVIVGIHDVHGHRTLHDPRYIRSLTLAELQTFDAGAWKHQRWKDERVLALREIVTSLPDGKKLVLELKEDVTVQLVKELSTAPRNRIVLIAFSDKIIAEAKRLLPECCALWLFNDYASVPKKQRGTFLATRVQKLGIDGVDLRHEYRLTAEIVEPLRAAGRTIFTYTINHASAARRCLKLGVDGITTDRPVQVRRWLSISA